jgi:hypothetical protein
MVPDIHMVLPPERSIASALDLLETKNTSAREIPVNKARQNEAWNPDTPESRINSASKLNTTTPVVAMTRPLK